MVSNSTQQSLKEQVAGLGFGRCKYGVMVGWPDAVLYRPSRAVPQGRIAMNQRTRSYVGRMYERVGKRESERARVRLHEWERILDERLAAGRDPVEASARVDAYRAEVRAWSEAQDF
jgi:hypothetical protein